MYVQSCVLAHIYFDAWVSKNCGRCVGFYVFKYLRIWRKVSHATVIIHKRTPSHLAPSSTTGTLFKGFFCLVFVQITCTLKVDDLAAAFSTTSLTELEQNNSSELVENDLS